MTEKKKDEIGRFICLLLRHKPEAAGLTLDRHGWAEINDLLAALSQKHPISRANLDEIVQTDGKGRYAISPDGMRIRACQGHSINVDVQMEEVVPPAILYHGSAAKYADGIAREGLLPRSRNYVHLSRDIETARAVGARHGAPIIYTVDAAAMSRDGYRFLLSENGVYQCKEVPAKYLSITEGS